MTPNGIRIEIHGVPRAQPRGRHVGGRVVSTTGPAVIWRRLVRQAAIDALMAATPGAVVMTPYLPLAFGPVELVLTVRFPTADGKRHGQWRTATRSADFDNVCKAIADELVSVGVIADDGQVARCLYEAVWVPPTECGATVIVRRLEPRQRVRIDAGGAPGWLGAT